MVGGVICANVTQLFFFLIFFNCLVFPPPITPHNMWDVSSPTRDGTSDPCIASSVFTTGLPGKSLTQLLKAGSPPLSVLIWNTSKIHVNI